ncbi:MoaB/Mog domain-containing protein [Radiomyces spectabilis]|uniref:MoaB/Mog domain-containing protein n=1 Tax=Radiomyces spectabilis TaxID=64574 RepID=UPI00221EF8A7|nr:MoaB/Mog domain-containing protein [Radiomyces spectabilis]KAI8384612.1 MoaB/Mog domain-containing protein [Radiomyces spectabilis]
MTSDPRFTAGVLTVSDTASQDPSQDKSGPLCLDILTDDGKYTVTQQKVVADTAETIANTIVDWSDVLGLDLIVVTGGTGFAPRDVTPEAVAPLLTRPTPGITHLLLSSSLNVTPFAALSRPVTGFRNHTLIITMPGSPKACKENLSAVLPVLPHGLDLQKGVSMAKVHRQMQESQGSDKSSDSLQSRKRKHAHPHHHKCIHRHDAAGHPSQTGLSKNLSTPVARRARSSPYPLISVQEAQDIVARYAKPIHTVLKPVTENLVGYILAEDVEAPEQVPGYPASVVDGYAVHLKDGPGVYPVVSASLADTNTECEPLAPGTIARITTGGMVPPGADAVVMVEDTKLIKASEDGQKELEVEILTSSSHLENIRMPGDDCEKGMIVCKAGQMISSVGGELGLLASVGVKKVMVYGKPRVGIMSSGNEVMDHLQTEKLGPGQIRDTNRLTLLAAVSASGFEAVDLGIVRDSVGDLEKHMREALNNVDVLITTGGVSMGEADFMKPILEQKLGATVHFGRVLMKPGKPTTFATIPEVSGHKLIFALPGNPVSATVTFYLFVLPALRRLSGNSQPDNVLIPVTMDHDIALDGRPEYHRVRVSISENGLVAESTGKQQSSRMLSLSAANGLLQLPASSDHQSAIKKGETVSCLLLAPLYTSA